MKNLSRIWVVSGLCLIAFMISHFVSPVMGGAARSVTEQVILPTQGGGSSGTPPCGVFGKNYIDWTASPEVYSYNPDDWPTGPPSSTLYMEPGSIGSNLLINLVGGEIGGKIILASGGNLSCGNLLKVGTKLDPPRSPAKANQEYISGTPTVPGDPGYEYMNTYDPQWDKDGDGDTDSADYDWVIQNGGLEGEGSSIPYTQPNDPTIMVYDKGILIPAVVNSDYKLVNNEFEDKNEDIYFTGTQYRFEEFKWGASDEFYFGETGNDTSIYADRWAQTASGDMIINNDKKLTVCIKDDVDISGSGKYNEGGKANQFDVCGSATVVDITGSGDAVAGQFYFPNADLDIAGSGMIYLAIVAKSITKTGSGDICYPSDYEGPPGGVGGSTTLNPPSRKDWKEIIVSD